MANLASLTLFESESHLGHFYLGVIRVYNSLGAWAANTNAVE